MEARKDCPKCAGGMAAGFIIDQGDYGSLSVSTWQGGPPRKSFWTGIKQSKPDQIEITTWRCGRCGFLESYAAPRDMDASASAV